MQHIAFIIGAGLTKALESVAPIPLMWDFISVMAGYIYEDSGAYDRTILNTLAGLENAGVFENTRADSQALARRVLRSNRPTEPSLTREEADAFRKIMQERTKENIEELLQRSLEKARDESR